MAAIRARHGTLGGGAKIGISWFSSGGNKIFITAKSSPLMAWRPVLRRPGARFVNLQYGDVAADLAAVEDAFGTSIFVDPEIDPVNQQVRIWAEIDNERMQLRPGMRGRLTIEPRAMSGVAEAK